MKMSKPTTDYRDGLHLNATGHAVVFKLFRRLIEKEYSKLDPANIPKAFPNTEMFSQGNIQEVLDQAEEVYRAYWAEKDV
jgi:hypothetical protein